jgi:hypothetical protein
VGWIGVWLFPLSTRSTRAAGAALAIVVWFGLILLLWRRRAARWALIGSTLLMAGFVSLPIERHRNLEELRGEYANGLLRYRGSHYYWGGESPRGIDCSGLVRRGLIDGLFLRGVRTGDAGLVRAAFWLWWHDATAQDLGEGAGGMTAPVLETLAIDRLDHSQLSVGDLAVTKSGLHIMAYLGELQWIEADPIVMRVIVVPVSARDNVWLHGPMKIVRWKILAGERN